ncbi:PEGA domain-containing protein [Paludisphaera soli]|uniref:PEGA domain-containing protein n=1 Tax=Paludisphaera soli TaxID=2712865 RepID=UPI0013ED0481|nr:PEGA domain-containing protein [Paludisphaera soli]
MVSSPKVGRRAAASLALAVACLCLNTGCVIRRYTIRSEPPGAQVIVNDEEIGPTPVSKQFTFYGDREVTLIKDGFETKTVIQPVPAPWWDNLLTEFFAENVVPFTLRDEREFTYDLQPAQSPAANDLYDRANNLRAESQAPPTPRRRGFLAWLGFD